MGYQCRVLPPSPSPPPLTLPLSSSVSRARPTSIIGRPAARNGETSLRRSQTEFPFRSNLITLPSMSLSLSLSLSLFLSFCRSVVPRMRVRIDRILTDGLRLAKLIGPIKCGRAMDRECGGGRGRGKNRENQRDQISRVRARVLPEISHELACPSRNCDASGTG